MMSLLAVVLMTIILALLAFRGISGFRFAVIALVLAIIVTLLALPCQAGPDAPKDIFDIPCATYGVPKVLVMAIAKQESDLKPWVVNVAGKDFYPKTKEQALDIVYAAKARGLSHDIGIMQINSWWLRKLNIHPEDAIEPHNNVQFGVWILAREIKRHGFGWRAVGFYHSPTPWRQQDYILRVARHYQKLKGTVQ